jgi:hypothetical protein
MVAKEPIKVRSNRIAGNVEEFMRKSGYCVPKTLRGALESVARHCLEPEETERGGVRPPSLTSTKG